MGKLELVEHISKVLTGDNYKWLCNDLFGKTGKYKRERDFCKICKMTLPKSYVFIDYTGQIRHILNNHNIEEIASFLKIESKSNQKIINKSIDILNCNKGKSQSIIWELLEEFEGKNIKIIVENILTGV
jgi:hypothetical protein